MPVFGVRDVRQSTPRTRILTVDVGAQPFPFVAGQAVLAGLDASPSRKPYSIASSPQQAAWARAFELLVQIEESSAPDPHLERAEAGTPLVIEGPFGSFSLPAAMRERQVLCIAGGTGIAPLRSILWDALERQLVDRAALIYSARSAAELAYREEFETLARDRRLDLHLTTTRDAEVPWRGGRGRIDAALIGSMLRTPATRCLVCGPPPLVADATAMLRQLGIAAELILTESDA